MDIVQVRGEQTIVLVFSNVEKQLYVISKVW